MNLPLLASWQISSDTLPDRLLSAAIDVPAFSLPGAQALTEFADLLGFEPEAPSEAAPAPAQAPFSLPGLIPEDVAGPVCLSRELDLTPFRFDRVLLSADMVCGSGEVYLLPEKKQFTPTQETDDTPLRLAAFHNQPLSLDLTAYLPPSRRCRVEFRFDAARPAGICGAVTLRFIADASFERVMLRPQPALQTIDLSLDVCALREGNYLLRAQLCPPNAPEDAPAIRERTLTLRKEETVSVQLAVEARCEAFTPGKPYAAPAVKLWLYQALPSGKPGALCDEALLLCGFPGKAPENWLPLTKADCLLPPETLLEQLAQAHITAISLPAAASDAHYRLFTRAGIAVRQTMETPPEERPRLMRYPCVTFEEAYSVRLPEESDLALSAWRLGGLVTYARTAEPDMTPADLLREMTGHSVNPADPAVSDVLAWLRAVSIRLRAEAIRQGKLSGPFCAPGEWNIPDVADALRTALAPLHLSTLPLCGAWWTLARFSASLYAFIPAGQFPNETALRAEATLEDAEGSVLARTELACPAKGGALGLLEAPLPEHACALELVTRLYADGELVEQNTLPVYVGDRGPLEAVF